MSTRSSRAMLVAVGAALAATMVATPSCGPGQARQTQSTAGLELTGHVVDQAGVLSLVARGRLADRLGRFERETTHQFVVVTVATLQGEDVTPFTIRLANRWGVGRKGVDDGIVLLVAPKDRKVRISVGDGLRRELPDSFCRQVVGRSMVPAFAQGRFDEGIEAGVSAVMDRVAAFNGSKR